jgi:hypothetical protein
MDAPTISIKIKGLQAVDALNTLGGLKINGANALVGLGGMEGNRAALAGKGLMMREMEMEGNRMLLQQAKAASMAKANVAQATAVGAKSAATGTAKAAGAAGTAGVTMFGSKGLGTLWLGGLGPWLVLTSLGLAATGIYFYLRAQRMMHENGGSDRDVYDRDEP